MAEGLYVYCVIGTGEARNFGTLGIGGRGDPVMNIAYQDLSAVVSTVPMDKYVVGQETMLAHEKVLEKVMLDYTVLPVRFYTIAPNAEDIRNLLRTRYSEFKKLLRELDNKVELGLKALWKDMNEVLRDVVGESLPGEGAEAGPSAGLNTNTRELRLALEPKKESVRGVLLQPFKGIAVDLCLNRTYGDDMIMNAAFLVDRSREREFDSKVDQLSAEHGDTIAFKYVGPAPPYSFVNIMIRDEMTTGEELLRGR